MFGDDHRAVACAVCRYFGRGWNGRPEQTDLPGSLAAAEQAECAG
jgi:hypothetical protein